MSDFNSQWIEIFRAGDYGDKGTFTAADVATLVANFDRGTHDAPAVIGHPESNAPAMGWVSAVKQEGPILLAQFEKVQPELEALVRDGRFPQRSIAFYTDAQGKGPMLRHVGFLGATPPEVKGLAAVKFSDEKFVEFNFEEDEMEKQDVVKTVKEEIQGFFKSLFGEKAPVASFSEEDVQKRIEAANKPLLEQMTKLASTFEESVKTATARALAADQAAHKSKVAAFVEKQRAAAKWVPAYDQFIPLLEQLAASGAEITFGEGDKKKTVSGYDALCQFIEASAAIVPLREVAGGKQFKSRSGKLLQFNEAKGIELDPGSLALMERAEAIEVERKIPYGEALKIARREMGDGAAAAGGTTAGAV